MSVRSFDQIVSSPEPLKLSVILLAARPLIVSNRRSYICNAVNVVMHDSKLPQSVCDDVNKRVTALLIANGVSTDGEHFLRRYNEIGNGDPCRTFERAARIMLIDLLVHNLQKGGL